MRKGSTLFAQIITTTLAVSDFRAIVTRHGRKKHAKRFTCWQKYVSVIFVLLGQPTSLRVIVDGMRGLSGNLSHLRLSSSQKHSSLSYANAHRSCEAYQEMFFVVLGHFQGSLAVPKRFRFKNNLLSVDAIVIDLWMTKFLWTTFRQTNGAVKVHVLLNYDEYFTIITQIIDGKGGDSCTSRQQIAMSEHLPKGSSLVVDRASVDFALFLMLTDRGVFFVTRLKAGMSWVTLEDRTVPQRGGILRDDLIEFVGKWATLRDQRQWSKTFAGDCENPLKTQVWTILITILLLLWMKSHAVWANGRRCT